MTAIERFGAPAPSLRRRYLPTSEASPTRLGSDEAVAVGMRRITTEQFTIAIDALTAHDGDLDAAATVARDALRRVAAMVRLVGSSIGDDARKAELDTIDAVDTMLDQLLAGSAELDALGDLEVRYADALNPDAFVPIRTELTERRQGRQLEVVAALRHDGDLIERSVRQLRRARARFGAWPVEEAHDGRQPLGDDFSVFADGITRAYRVGRDESRADNPRLSRWRRATRDLAHQVDAVSCAWPEMLTATARTAAGLADALQAHHRMATLLSTASTSPIGGVDEPVVAMVDALATHECRELMGIADALATRLYAEKPSRFVARLDDWWATRN